MRATVVERPGGPEELQLRDLRVFSLDELADAHGHMEANRAIGKVVAVVHQP